MWERLIDEILEVLWNAEETGRGEIKRASLGENLPEEEGLGEALGEGVEQGFFESKADALLFTPKGRERARNLVRRHRLAERLLSDTLDLESEEVESAACKFEHLLSAAATNSVCILLGHPATCPHGKPIPEGECCKKGITDIRPLVIPASRLRLGEEATVAYVGTKERGRLERLAILGILPGNKIKLEQRHPSYVIWVDETQLGLDDDIAEEIYVRPFK